MDGQTALCNWQCGWLVQVLYCFVLIPYVVPCRGSLNKCKESDSSIILTTQGQEKLPLLDSITQPIVCKPFFFFLPSGCITKRLFLSTLVLGCTIEPMAHARFRHRHSIWQVLHMVVHLADAMFCLSSTGRSLPKSKTVCLKFLMPYLLGICHHMTTFTTFTLDFILTHCKNWHRIQKQHLS